MRKILKATGAIGIALAALTIGQPASAADEITIGAIYPMTGSASFLGVPEDRALRMKVEEWNKAGGLGGRQVKVIVYDTEGNTGKAAQQLRRLIESDKVDVVFGPSTSGESLAVIPLANELKTPIIAHGGTESIVVPPLPYVFNSVPVDRVAIAHVLNYAKRNNLKRVVMMNAADGYGQSGTRILKELAASFGVEVVGVEEFNRQDLDNTPQVLRAQQLKPDAIIVWSALPGPTVILKNASTIGYKVPIIVGYGAASNQLVANIGAAAEGTYISSFRLLVPDSLKDGDPSKPVVQKLFSDFKGKYGEPPENFAQHSYDAALILEQAVKQIKGPVTRDALRDAIESVKVVGANGSFNFTKENHGGLSVESMPLIMLRYESGKWKVVE